MSSRWIALCERIGRPPPDAVAPLFSDLERLYSTPPRPYHSLAHVADCLREFDSFAHLAARPILVEWSLWLHDCIYEPARKDNEQESAAVSACFLTDLGADPALQPQATVLILATRHTGEPLTGDAALIADIDMSILAAPAATYDRYAAAICQEYSFTPDSDYRRGRSAFVASLLARPAIYHLAPTRAAFESAARANLARELAALSAP